MPPPYAGIKRYRDLSVCLSVPRRSCLGYRRTGCLQLSHRRPPEMCELRTRPLQQRWHGGINITLIYILLYTTISVQLLQRISWRCGDPMKWLHLCALLSSALIRTITLELHRLSHLQVQRSVDIYRHTRAQWFSAKNETRIDADTTFISHS